MPQLCCKPNSQKDKGYAWFISVASFLSNFTHTGFSYGIAGNLTIAHQQFFNIDLQKGSLLGTIHVGVLMLFGEFAVLAVHLIVLSTSSLHFATV